MSAAWHISRTTLNTVLSTAYSSSCTLSFSFFLGIGRPAYRRDSIYYYPVDSCFSCTSAWILLHRESGRQDCPRDRIKDDPFRVLDGVGRMLDLVFFDGTFCNGINADRRLATFARAIWLGTLRGEVPRLVTIVLLVPQFCPAGLGLGLTLRW